jgi:hypothetical protein
VRLRIRPSLLAAAALIGLAAVLMVLAEEKPLAQRPEVEFPRRMKQEEWRRVQARRTLAPRSDPAAASQGSPTGNDPFLVALPGEAGKPLIVLEANALRHSRVGELFVDCVLRGFGDDPLEDFRREAGIDLLKDVDRVAFSPEGGVVSGFFGGARFDRLEAEMQLARYGDEARIYSPRADRGRLDPSLAVWRDQLVAFGSASFVRTTIDQLEGRAAVAQPPIPEELTYGEAYGVIPGEALLPLFRGAQSELGARLAAVASRIEIHVDAMRDVAIVARVTGPDAAQLDELGKSIGAALALARLDAKMRGAAGIADVLEFARVEPARGAFSVEVALPVDVVERWFAGCREGLPESGAQR